MADKKDFADRLARIEEKNAKGSLEPELMAGVTQDGPEIGVGTRRSSRAPVLALSLLVGFGLIGGAFYTMILHMEQDAPGLRAAITSEGRGFNPLEFFAKSTAGEESWTNAQEGPLEDRYLNEDGSAKLSSMGRFILNN